MLIAAWRRGILRRAAIATALLVPALMLVPAPLGLALLLQRSDVSTQLDRPVYDVAFTARPHLYLLPSADNPLFGDFSRDFVTERGLRPNEGELALYVGIATLVLALAGFYFAARGQVPRLGVALAAAMALLGLALALPATVELPVLGDVSMPIAYLNDALQFVSTPTRFFALTLTGIVVLAALGLEGLARRVDPKVAISLVAAACLLSALELPFRRDGFVVSTRSPELVRAINDMVPKGAAIAQYPSLARDFLVVANQLFYQLDHRRPVLNGAPSGTLADGVRASVENKADPNLGPKLALLGFDWATLRRPTGLASR